MTIVLTNVTIIDGSGASPLAAAAIVIDGEQISGIVSAEAVTHRSDLTVYDLQGMTLLPGLIDTHVHLLGQRSLDPRDHMLVGEGLRAARASADLRRLLEAGITTVRDCGSYTALALKQAVAEQSIPGPRILAAGRFIERTGGPDDTPALPLAWAQCGGVWGPRLADGPDACRLAVREQLRDGADWIKTCSTGAATTHPDSRPDLLEWSPEELHAIIDEAHRRGVRAAVHAHAAQGIKAAVAAGADSIEHGTYLDDEGARMMADRRVVLVPTFFVMHRIARYGAAYGIPSWILAKARGETLQVRERSFQLALHHGVPIAMGTDCAGQPLLPHGQNATELALMVQAGMAPHDALVAATGGAARALGIDRSVGTIAVGQQADIIGVAGDPLHDITLLQSVQLVIQSGRVIVDHHDVCRNTAIIAPRTEQRTDTSTLEPRPHNLREE